MELVTVTGVFLKKSLIVFFGGMVSTGLMFCLIISVYFLNPLCVIIVCALTA